MDKEDLDVEAFEQSGDINKLIEILSDAHTNADEVRGTL
jgi:hypothetical protein